MSASPAQKRRVTILGSTGSIGCNTVELLAADPDIYAVEALVASRNALRLAEQAQPLNAKFAVVADESQYRALKDGARRQRHRGGGGRGRGGRGGGAAGGLGDGGDRRRGRAGADPGGGAARRDRGARQQGGAGLRRRARDRGGPGACGARLLPVDSEHNAIFQVFDFEQRKAIEHIVLTASGGPFRKASPRRWRRRRPAQAVAHPNWRMGAKISVDSATMMNKGLEVIEAHHLFALASERLDIVVHPQSVVHGLVYYSDGSVLAQLGSPDMRTPIANALGWPDRIAAPSPRLDLAKLAQLTFEAPDPERFPALRVARAALVAGGGAPTVLNAANEVAVASFLDGRIGFLDIAATVERTLERLPDRRIASLDDVYALDREARATARRLIGGNARRAALA